jgi:hypothetical protein
MAAKKNPEKTTLDEDNTKPSTTAPGDGPADTTDPEERASSIIPQPGPEALKVGTVNAVQPVPAEAQADKVDPKDARIEKYKATRPDGTEVTVTHNLETGETSLS